MISKEELRLWIEMSTEEYENDGGSINKLPERKTRNTPTRVSHFRDEIRRKELGLVPLG